MGLIQYWLFPGNWREMARQSTSLPVKAHQTQMTDSYQLNLWDNTLTSCTSGVPRIGSGWAWERLV